jgi:hypothetical protein
MIALNTKDKILQGLMFFGYFLCVHAAFFVIAILTEILNYVSKHLLYTEAILFLLMPVYGLVLSYYLVFQKKTDINDIKVYKASKVFMFINIPISIAVVFLIYYMGSHLNGL